MKEFILINRVPATYSPADAQSVMPQWDAVTEKWKADDVFVASYVFPSVGSLVSDKGSSVKFSRAQTGELRIVSTLIIRALSQQDAVEMGKSCPVLQQEGTVEVIELMKRHAT